MAELSTDSSLKLQFSQIQLGDFLLYVMTEYPELEKRAFKCLTVFSFTYLYETAFSLLTYLKSKLKINLMSRVDIVRGSVNFKLFGEGSVD